MPSTAMDRLPVDDFIPAIHDALRRRRAVVLSAPPGAGKTTRVPPALTADGRVILLQPRRVAARAVARRIAEERGWTLGREVGWQIRFERRFTDETRLLVVTEGVLTARLQQDPLLTDITTVVLDEFHERSIHADLGLALARQAWLARDELRLVVMSATLDVTRVAAFLDDCPVLDVPGARHRLDIEYAPGEPIAAAIDRVLGRTSGSVLGFLPGAREIARAQSDLTAIVPRGIEVLPLHGSLEAPAQDAVIRGGSARRVILATNIAETSLTVPDVFAVVDAGLVKTARYDVARGVDSLVTERVTLDSADQRAGRAARLGPGVAVRLWDARDRLRPHREPEIARVDLAGPVLDLLAWGARPATFDWFEAPPAERVETALRLLRQLGAIDGTGDALRITSLGRLLRRMPLHPRLARILIEAGASPEAAAACALLSEPIALGAGGATTSSDVLPMIDTIDRQPPHVRDVARQLRRLAETVVDAPLASMSDDRLRRAIYLGYADRLARRRPGHVDRFMMASGHGASLGRESGVRQAEFVVALDVTAGEREGASEARIRAASAVDREWIVPTGVAIEHRLDADSGRVRALQVSRVGALVVGETPVAADAERSADLLAEAWLQRQPDEPTRRLLRRLRFAGIAVDLPALVRQAAASATSLDAIDPGAQLDYATSRALAERAPDSLVVPSGRTMRLEYEEDGSVSMSVKLQELFGLAESPRLGPNHVPVTVHLLAPNGRPVQTTRDLRNFWNTTYTEVRKELRGRYPKHPWPDDPWTAPATHRTTPRG